MSKPSHVLAFEKFNQQIESHLEASVAFGLFLRSEQAWAQEQLSAPTEAKYRNHHGAYLTAHEIGRYRDSARQFLADFSDEVVATKQAEFLNDAVTQYQAVAAVGHSKFRKWGVTEAVVGAFIWSILLIAISIIAARNGIDIVEIYKRAVGHPAS